MMRTHLDLSAIEAFVVVADMRSFTLAGDELCLTQAAVSLRLRRLEESLGRRLLIRSPRQVRLSPDGEAFLPRARMLLDAQKNALAPVDISRCLTFGISDHVAGPELPSILAKLRAYDPDLFIKVRVNSSRVLLAEFERREIDVAIVRRGSKTGDSEALFEECHGWYSSMDFEYHGEQLPLVSVVESCGLREAATQLLNDAGFSWVESFVGGGIATAINAVTAGIGVAPLPHRLAHSDLIEIGPELGLPELPRVPVVMLTNHVEPQSRETLKALIAAVHSSIPGKRTDANVIPASVTGMSRSMLKLEGRRCSP
jgi:DNA-binding transcriptional LysR family regulator